jgi:hypothetical protein
MRHFGQQSPAERGVGDWLDPVAQSLADSRPLKPVVGEFLDLPHVECSHGDDRIGGLAGLVAHLSGEVVGQSQQVAFFAIPPRKGMIAHHVDGGGKPGIAGEGAFEEFAHARFGIAFQNSHAHPGEVKERVSPLGALQVGFGFLEQLFGPAE